MQCCDSKPIIMTLRRFFDERSTVAL